MQELALDSVKTITVALPGAKHPEIDVKKYVKIEKIPGGAIEDSRVLRGVMFEKDVVSVRVCGGGGKRVSRFCRACG
jgi:T-complex protein 1 subunit gamma